MPTYRVQWHAGHAQRGYFNDVEAANETEAAWIVAATAMQVQPVEAAEVDGWLPALIDVQQLES